MSSDIIPARSGAEWPSTPQGPCPEDGHGIMSSDIITARSEAEWPSTPQGPCPEDEVYDEESVYASGRM